MKFKVFSIMILVLTGSYGCIKSNHKKIVVQHPDGYYKEVYYVLDDSIKDGSYQKFFPDGKLWDSCYYKNDTIEGIRKIFSNKGYIEVIENYKNGVLDGNYQVLYPEGKIKLNQTYNKGVLEGFSLAYYPNGNIKEKVTMKNNEENGSFEDYYENGKIHWKGTYLNGDNEHDTLYEYDDTGILIKKMFCQYGVCQTVWTKEKGEITDLKILPADKELLKQFNN